MVDRRARGIVFGQSLLVVVGLPGSSDKGVVVGGLVGGGGDGDDEDDDEDDEGSFQFFSKRFFSFAAFFSLSAALTILHCKLYLQKHVLRQTKTQFAKYLAVRRSMA